MSKRRRGATETATIERTRQKTHKGRSSGSRSHWQRIKGWEGVSDTWSSDSKSTRSTTVCATAGQPARHTRGRGNSTVSVIYVSMSLDREYDICFVVCDQPQLDKIRQRPPTRICHGCLEPFC